MSSNTLAPHGVDSRHVPVSGMRRLVDLHLQELVSALVAIGLVVFFTIESPYFFTSDNAATLASFISPIAFFALAEVPILILGEIDLSVGEMYVLSPFVVGYFADAGVPVPVSLIGALLVCCALGLINGLVTVKLHIPSFIATLSMTFALEGVILIRSNGAPATPVGTGNLVSILGGLTWSEAIWALIIAAMLHLMLRGTTFGLHIVAVGGNTESARESGIKVDFSKIWCFVLCAGLGGVIGILDSYHIGSIDPASNGLSFMFYGVAAAVIGGTALTGGRGTMIGACIGASVLGILEDGFHILSISSFAYDLILGLAILFAMILNVQIERAGSRQRGRGLVLRAVNLIFARRRKVSVRR
jgi:simple sugar transport system permease protein